MNICGKDFVSKLQPNVIQTASFGTGLVLAMRELSQLNYQYLQLFACRDLPEKISGELTQLSEAALLTLSQCFFSFFTLSFDDCDKWLPLFVDSDRPGDDRDFENHERTNFVTTVVFFAWHLACADALTAKAVIQLDERIATALSSLPIGRLRVISARAVGLLAPRWRDNDFFWSTLARCTIAPSDDGVQVVKFLGRQLLATESLGLVVEMKSQSKMLLDKGTSDVQKSHLKQKRRINQAPKALVRVTD